MRFAETVNTLDEVAVRCPADFTGIYSPLERWDFY